MLGNPFCRLSLAGLALVALLVGKMNTADAALITLHYQATITDITHTNGGFGDTTGYTIGGTTRGTVTFNDDASDSHGDPNFIVLKLTNVPIPLSISITSDAGLSSFNIVGSDPAESRVSIREDYNGGGILSDYAHFASGNGPDQIILTLLEEATPPAQPNLLTILDLSLSTLDVTQANSFNELGFIIRNPADLNRWTIIKGEITYLSATPVPIPAALPLFLSAIVFLGSLARKYKTA